MAIFSIVSVLLGAVLGLRFKVLILVPTIGIGFLVVLAEGLLRHDSLMRVALAFVLMTTCLQLGYLAGIGIQLFFLWARVAQRYPRAGKKLTHPMTRSTS
jgi:hypothetical protein